MDNRVLDVVYEQVHKEITTAMNKQKEEDKKILLDQIIDLNDSGFDTTKISDTLASLGINTVTLVELENRKFSKLRDEIVLNKCFERKIPVQCSMGGGYSEELKIILEAHSNTFRIASKIF